jgi:cell division protease FtsH
MDKKMNNDQKKTLNKNKKMYLYIFLIGFVFPILLSYSFIYLNKTQTVNKLNNSSYISPNTSVSRVKNVNIQSSDDDATYPTENTNELRTLSFSEFKAEENNKNIKTANIFQSSIKGTLKNDQEYLVFDASPNEEVNNLVNSGVDVTYVSDTLSFSTIINIFMLSFMVYIVYSILKNKSSGNPMESKANSFLSSSANKNKKADGENNDKTINFSSIAGIEEAKSDVVQIVEFLKNPTKFSKLGGKIPRGILMVGPPGTGKTLLAKAIANEAKVPFIYKSGSEFVEMFVGVGSSRVRAMFEKAAKEAPCIIFIDEIDSLGGKRSNGNTSGGNDEKAQTLNEFLTQMDGFQVNKGILVIGATNRVDMLDSALLRPGRFDRQIFINLPDIKGRRDILNVHSKNIIMSSDVDILKIAKGTPGFSGADLANLVNESAILAANHDFEEVKMEHFEQAKDKIMLGSERKTYMMSQKDRDITAYHEAGHAICAIYNEHSDPIYKATIIPRGRALGMVMRLPENDGVSQSKAKIKGELVVAMGGRSAEEIVFGKDHVTTGASGDIKMATTYARKMVTEWGFSDEIGYVYIPPFNNAFTEEHTISSDLSKTIDNETKSLIEEAKEKAMLTLNKYRDQLELIANALKEKETLTGEEILELCGITKNIKASNEEGLVAI